jgi:hypothetical protein
MEEAMDTRQAEALLHNWTLLVLRRFAGRQEIPLPEVRRQIDTLLDTCEPYFSPMVKPALAERGLHSQAHYLTEAGFHDEQPDLRHTDRERQAMFQVFADVSAGVKQLVYTTRLQRMDDDGLLAPTEQAVTSDDIGVAGLRLEEAGLRKNSSMLVLKVRALTDQIEVPEATAAPQVFDVIEDTIAEFAEVERFIMEPANQFAKAPILSRAIREETEARELAERTAEEEARREQAKKEEAEKKAAAAEYLKKAEELPTKELPPRIETHTPLKAPALPPAA